MMKMDSLEIVTMACVVVAILIFCIVLAWMVYYDVCYGLRFPKSVKQRKKGEKIVMPFSVGDTVYAIHFDDELKWTSVKCQITGIKENKRRPGKSEIFIRSALLGLEGSFKLQELGHAAFQDRWEAYSYSYGLNR